MGKLDLIKGQAAYLVEKSNKRKKPHEQDNDENATGHLEKVRKPRKPKNLVKRDDSSDQWKILNHQAFTNPNPMTSAIYIAPPPAINVTAVPYNSVEPGPSFSTDPLRPAKKAKVSAYSTFVSTRDDACPLCGGPKHNLSDCLVPKGGIEK